MCLTDEAYPACYRAWSIQAAVEDALTPSASILVVDDQRDGREMLAEYLAHCGFAVHAVGDGVEAIDAAVSIHPAVILMDLMMPKLDGWEATRRLKADARTSDITIVAVSACASADAKRVARQAGCDHFITKPCDLPVLVDTLRGILNRRCRSGSQARAPIGADIRNDAERDPRPPAGQREIAPISLADAIAADIARDDAIAAAIMRGTGR